MGYGSKLNHQDMDRRFSSLFSFTRAMATHFGVTTRLLSLTHGFIWGLPYPHRTRRTRKARGEHTEGRGRDREVRDLPGHLGLQSAQGPWGQRATFFCFWGSKKAPQLPLAELKFLMFFPQTPKGEGALAASVFGKGISPTGHLGFFHSLNKAFAIFPGFMSCLSVILWWF